VSFAEDIRKARLAKGYTQGEIARALGLAGPDAVIRWETGKFTPRYPDLILATVKKLPKSKNPRAGKAGPIPRKKKGGK
jgi:transcriptional regulator with XRE-family HTH domain